MRTKALRILAWAVLAGLGAGLFGLGPAEAASPKLSSKYRLAAEESSAETTPPISPAPSPAVPAQPEAKPAEAAPPSEPKTFPPAPIAPKAAGPAKPTPSPEPPKTAPAKAAPPAKAGPDQGDEPIKIISNRLEADDKVQTVTFTGQVQATQGETKLWCDKMVVHYLKEENPGQTEGDDTGSRKIKKIEVFGHVKVVKMDKTALGQQGLYEMETRRAVIWGKARLIQGANIIDGDRVILFLAEDRAVVEGGPDKVEATLIPSKEEKPKTEAKPPAPGPEKKPGGGKS